jgi:hypothetical protein
MDRELEAGFHAQRGSNSWVTGSGGRWRVVGEKPTNYLPWPFPEPERRRPRRLWTCARRKPAGDAGAPLARFMAAMGVHYYWIDEAPHAPGPQSPIRAFKNNSKKLLTLTCVSAKFVSHTV